MVKNKPFIKLLRSPNRGYFFDVNRNEIIPVRDEIYNYLEAVMLDLDEEASLETIKSVENLKQNGYLSSNKVKVFEHSYSKYINSFLNRGIRKVTLQLTQNCNFRCKYCSYTQNDVGQRLHSDKQMSFEIAKKGIDFLWEHSVDSKSVDIGFYGGEPLLNFKLIEQIIEYCEVKFDGKEHTYTMTTNGTLLSDEIIKVLSEYKINMTISLDGHKQLNDKNRVFANSNKSTFDVIYSKIKYIRENYPEYLEKIGINMVIDPSNDFDTAMSLYNDLMFEGINIRSMIIDDINSSDKNVYAENFVYKQRYFDFLNCLSYLGKNVDDEKIYPYVKDGFTFFLKIRDLLSPTEKLPEKAAPAGTCIPAQDRLFITAEGNFIPCERVSEVSDAAIIGNVDTGFDMDKVYPILNLGKLTEDECRNCWAFNRCSLCFKHADDGKKLTGERKREFCGNVLNSTEKSLYLTIFLNEAVELYNI